MSTKLNSVMIVFQHKRSWHCKINVIKDSLYNDSKIKALIGANSLGISSMLCFVVFQNYLGCKKIKDSKIGVNFCTTMISNTYLWLL